MLSFLKPPQISGPLAKAIRTSEGVLVFAFNVVVAVGAALDPSKLPPKEAGILVAATTIAHSGLRTLLKVTAIQKGFGVGAPAQIEPVPVAEAGELASDAAEVVGDVLSDRLPTAVTPDLPAPAPFDQAPAVPPPAGQAWAEQPPAGG